MAPTIQTRTKVAALLDRLQGKKRVLIMSHTNPDPDSMGGGFGMRYLIEQALEIPTSFAYRGHIFRAENLEMVNSLGLGLVKVDDIDIGRFDGLVVVDTQPGFGHTQLPDDLDVDGVIDHHVPPPGAVAPDCFVDVRTDVGATCSIVTGYLMDLGLDVPPRVATALFYGIRTDTADLSRNTSDLDERAYLWLMERCDRSALARISNPSLPKDYYSAIRTAMNGTRIYGKVIVCSLGQTSNPQIVAEMADLLVRLHGAEWVVTGGLYESTYYISVRARHFGRDAWSLLDEVLKGEGSFGGHGTVGGASIQLKDPSPRTVRRLERKLMRSLLDALGEAQTTAVSLS
ncbi:MAG: DHH family phosphoesterase [Planctomycetota bacterium]